MAPQLRDFIDFHLHILPGLDDGPKNIQQSLALARCYKRAGVRTVVATPHYIPGTSWAPTRDKVIETVTNLQTVIDRADITLNILPGMEIAYHRKLQEHIDNGLLLPLGHSDHYLIEPPFHSSPDELVAVLPRMVNQGYKMILAHPERIDAFQYDPGLVQELFKQGVLMQVTSGSLLGTLGSRSKYLAQTLCQWGCVDFIASDAHDAAKRPPLNDDDWNALCTRSGGEKLLKSCITNANRLFQIG